MKHQKRFYMTKNRKRQATFWKIITAVSMVSVVTLGATNTYTDKYILSMTSSTIDLPHLFTEVKAESLESQVKPIGEPKFIPYNESVADQIRRIAAEENFKWPEYLVRLAKCESTLNPNAKNVKNNLPANSIDRGLMQYNSYWHPEISDKCAYDVECSVKAAIKHINAGRQGEWVCSRLIK